jgi:hypothetical protein
VAASIATAAAKETPLKPPATVNLNDLAPGADWRAAIVLPKEPSLAAAKYGPRHVLGQQNKTESRYADLIEVRKRAGEVRNYHFEAFNLKLAGNRCYFRPDFVVWLVDGTIEIVDVKGGFIQDKSLIKIKVAAQTYPEFRFVIEQYVKGEFQRREF